MKKKLLKVLSTATLSLAVVSTATVGTVLAAEGNQSRSQHYICLHESTAEYREYEYEEANSEFHWCYEYVSVVCDECGDELRNYFSGETIYEYHDLSGYLNGNWVCVDCGYEERPGG